MESLSALLAHLLTGLANTASLFLVAVGLSLIFGVSRIVNFAHGSLYMLGLYSAISIIAWLQGFFDAPSVWAFWGGILLSAVLVGLIGGLIEFTVLRRLYRAPELLQLLATFAIVLIVRDASLALWGAEDILGPRAPGLHTSVEILGHWVPSYDLLLIVLGPVVLALLHLLMRRTRFGRYLRAATQDRTMLAALGVNQAWLFTAVFALGSALAGLGGALAIPREPANLGLDLHIVGDAFVVVVIGGLGSLPGAYVAALLISTVKAVFISVGTVSLAGVDIAFPKLTLVAEFMIMAAVLLIRPWGLFGRELALARGAGHKMPALPKASPAIWLGVLAATLAFGLLVGTHFPYGIVLGTDILIAVLFAVSLHFLMGPAGIHSFGHAAFFGLGAYGLAWGLQGLGLSPLLAFAIAIVPPVLGALLMGLISARLSGVYLAMLTLAFAQIVWSVVFQWDTLTGGSNGLLGLWPPTWLPRREDFFIFTALGVAIAIGAVWHILFAPLGWSMRASRDAPQRAVSIGIDRRTVQTLAFVFSALLAGMAGALFVWSKGSVSPEVVSIGRSVDGLVMVLLGGLQTLTGPIIGAALLTLMQDTVARETEYWRAALGALILLITLLAPAGLAAALKNQDSDDEKPPRPEPHAAEPIDQARTLSTDPPTRPRPARAWAPNTPRLSLHHLHKSFGGVHAVDGVSLTLHAGEMLALIGPNGAGKTTCFQLLNGQLRPDQGRVIRHNGEQLQEIQGSGPLAVWRRGIGRTFQISAVFHSMTVLENVQMALLAAQGAHLDTHHHAIEKTRAQAEKGLAAVGLLQWAHAPSDTLAYGDIKRLELAMALAADPDILLMDEPTAGMSAGERRALMDGVRQLVREQGLAVLYTEHSMDVVFDYADRIAVLASGRLIAVGPSDDIRQNPEVLAVYLGSPGTAEGY